ncbi:MAG: MBOAT family protein, partial [Lachnospiraceae bacterium]|nr:MBOAT family protein [Lachnospiraceae bacterium]
IAFFPQLIAGPIVRYETVANEIKYRKETLVDFTDGFARFIIGLSKKVLLANTFAVVADKAFNLCSVYSVVSTQMAWLGAISYTMQIFFDFSGYSDMGIGLGRMFGFHFLENFNYPYISKSITEFWRRWHISLGTWFRDYVYFPLGGSRVKTKARLVFNLFVVWMLTGIWHGAEWSFFLWGFMYFVLLVFEKLSGINTKEGKVINAIKHIYTLFFVIIGWVLFRAENMHHALLYLKCMFSFGTVEYDGMFNGYFLQNAVMLSFGVICCLPLFKKLSIRFSENKLYGAIRLIGLCTLFVICLANLVSNSYNPFIYFNF